MSHFLVPAALYFALRDPVASLLLMYVWESVELAVYMIFKGRYVMFAGRTDTTTRETAGDSLLGDPLMGATGIAVFFVADKAFSWPGPLFSVLWPGTLRFFAFLTQAALSLAVDAQTRGGKKIGAAIFGAGYILFAALFYGIPLARNDTAFSGDPDARETRAKSAANLAFLLALAAAQTLHVVLVRKDLQPLRSVWLRVFALGIVSLLGVSVAGTGTVPLIVV